MWDVKTSALPFKILLVEDDWAHAELVTRGFEDIPIPCEIAHVPDGAAALDYLFRRGEYADDQLSPRPHIILLDLRLPRVDGLEVLRQIKSSEALRTIPVVILTTSSNDNDVKRAYDLHTNSYMVKPSGFEGFFQLTNELGSYWLERNHQSPM